MDGNGRKEGAAVQGCRGREAGVTGTGSNCGSSPDFGSDPEMDPQQLPAHPLPCTQFQDEGDFLHILNEGSLILVSSKYGK